MAAQAYSVLIVRIAGSSASRPESDLTARARIRDAAITCFAEEGFGASVRTIATRAGVTPGLITHHFGSKSALRAECDDEVLQRYKATKTDAVDRPGPHLLEGLTGPSTDWQLLVYILRVIQAGGLSAAAFLEHLVDDAREVMAHGVASGLVRPSRDEESRLRYLAHQAIGALLVQFLTMPDLPPAEFARTLRRSLQETILPTLELYTEGILADRSMLEDYLRFRDESPAG